MEHVAREGDEKAAGGPRFKVWIILKKSGLTYGLGPAGLG
jgi:hypothetical protein